ncbi:MAG: 4Fe-4S dicluster domain-containing protein [Gemmatimonadetes bacterium]|nr:4Fe-4S dicluster domain-containing protein [Gemmatimonadota bacterium]
MAQGLQRQQPFHDYPRLIPRDGDRLAKRVGMLYDMTRCIGCQACTVACKQWFDHYATFDERGLQQDLNRPHKGSALPTSYQSMNDLTWQDYTMMRFYEVEHAAPVAGGSRVSWHFLKDACHHCGYAPCAAVCPVNAIAQMENGQIVIDHNTCIGCGYCVNGCWAHIPRLHPETGKAYKCDFCYDRTSHGLEPMCSKACPTDCIVYGYLEDLREIAEKRVEEYNRLKPEGAHPAWIYDNREDLDGMGVFYVLNAPIEVYEGPTIPKEPKVPDAVLAWQDVAKPLGWLSFWGMVGAAFLHFVTFGPKELPEPEELEQAEASSPEKA